MIEDKRVQNSGVQNVILENRERMSISGVIDVESFNDEMVVVDTELGILVVRGEELRINKLSLESSELNIEGYITGCEYSEREGRARGVGLFAKLFR
ncbi:MAG: sporulation protein YabP [Clostridium sp.]|nr:sporulation protein YabP [Clostridium sp.]